MELYCHETFHETIDGECDATQVPVPHAPETPQTPRTTVAHVRGVSIDLHCDETLPPKSPCRPPAPNLPGDLCTVDEMLRVLVQNL